MCAGGAHQHQTAVGKGIVVEQRSVLIDFCTGIVLESSLIPNTLTAHAGISADGDFCTIGECIKKVPQPIDRRPVHADVAAAVVVEGAFVHKPVVAHAVVSADGDFCRIGERAKIVVPQSLGRRPVNADVAAAVVVEGGLVPKPGAAYVGSSADGDFSHIVERA